jgi:hypothetical protein
MVRIRHNQDGIGPVCEPRWETDDAVLVADVVFVLFAGCVLEVLAGVVAGCRGD